LQTKGGAPGRGLTEKSKPAPLKPKGAAPARRRVVQDPPFESKGGAPKRRDRESDAVGNGGLHAIEEEEAAEEEDDDGGGRSCEKRAGRNAMAGQSPAEAVDDAGHGIEAVEPAPALGYERRGIGDGGSEHPELHEEGRDVFDVAIESVERSKPEADAEGSGNGEYDEKRKPESGEGGGHAVVGEKNDQDGKADGEVDETGKDGGKRKDKAGEIHFGDDALIVDDDVGGGEESAGKINPRNEGGEIKNRIRKACGWKLGEAPEEKCENDHAEKRLENDPKDADGRLLVTNFYVAPNEEVEEFAVTPKLGEAEFERGAGRLDADDGGGRGKRKSGRRRGGSDRSHQVVACDSEKK